VDFVKWPLDFSFISRAPISIKFAFNVLEDALEHYY
jgi:hypothetical protein